MTETCTAAPQHFNSSYCKFVKCGDYRKGDDRIGQKCCQITGYIPGNMPMCPHDMDPAMLERYSDRRRSIQEEKKPEKIVSSKKHCKGCEISPMCGSNPDIHPPGGPCLKELSKVSTKSQYTRSRDGDPICDECCLTLNDPEGHACKWCNEEQEKHGRRACLSTFNLRVLYNQDCQDALKGIFPESIDIIFTDPPYVTEQWEEAYNTLADIGQRVLKPSGFMFTYVPQYRLDAVLDIIRARGLLYYWIIPQLNVGKNTGVVHVRNAICLHKPILVFQKPPLKKAPKIFADVIRSLKQKQYHPWQQSIHDVLGLLSRFCNDPEKSFGKDIVLDPFAGTGTTLLAAQLLGLDWIGFENDPDTHKIALSRMEQRPLDLYSFKPARKARSARGARS